VLWYFEKPRQVGAQRRVIGRNLTVGEPPLPDADDLGMNPIVTLGKQLLNMIGKMI
jgi:hypothetical protein